MGGVSLQLFEIQLMVAIYPLGQQWRMLGRLVLCALGLCPLAIAGCNRVQKIEPTKEVEVLYKIQSAYDLAYNQMGRPLKNYDELKPFLSGVQDPQTELVSPNDSLPYVIVYGVDRRNFDKGIPILAYEQQGTGGVRRVLTAMGIDSMDEATFRSRVPQAAMGTKQ
jgi:hypothetical protein